jgi:CheY-like chemotaxis protein
LAVARGIRRAEAGHLIHWVALTGDGRPADHALTQQAGFDAHLVKPVNTEALESMLAEWCEQSHNRRSSFGGKESL